MTREEREIIEAIKSMGYDRTAYPREKVSAVISMAIEALKDRPKGEWIESDIGWKCSECNYGVKQWNNTDFCPNCGADMRGAEMISPKAFAEKMGQIAETKDDTEVCHRKMDDYICEVLRTLGYEEGVEIFENTPKWYS